MKKRNLIYAMTLVLMTTMTFAQTAFKEHKAGHVFYVSLPDYMSKTTGLNDAAVIQFKNSVKDIAGFVIEDNKEELALAEMIFSSIKDFYDNFIGGFLVGEKKRTISEAKSQTIGNVKFMECDASYYDKDSKIEIYYFIGIAETKDAFYKVLCYGSIEAKTKYKADFQKILYSLKD
ncbi:hypothetical protein [Lacihabitans soyangensis]|uniref:DUF4252 domain-containing protein n=1 Tax=Lacihabitans soyangensis TaxID=869394 RepID=A0AAE3GZV8_9BACT|nr:hypothetical protein [Lacihabitans soyangensis]MCP9762332.1 hypothetical protein [Lacihabitans soyangensis]